MGVETSLTVGVGVHFPPAVVDAWMEDNDPDGEGEYDVFERLLDPYRLTGITFEWVGDAWIGDFRGVVIWAAGSESYDVGRSDGAGVYRNQPFVVTLAERLALNEISKRVAGKELPIEPLVTVTVS